MVCHLEIFNQLHQHFRIRGATESISFLLQFIFQHGIVFNNTVMNKSKVFGRRVVRMGICLTRFAMSSPTGMGYADGTGDIFLRYKGFQLGHFTFRFIDVQVFVITNQCHTGTVITTILQPLQSLYQNRIGFSVTYITDYSTHKLLNLVSVANIEISGYLLIRFRINNQQKYIENI